MTNLYRVLAISVILLGSGAPDAWAYQTSSLPTTKAVEPRLDSVLVSRSPDSEWTAKPTRTLAQLPELPLDASGARYGGIAETKYAATGFFHTRKIGNRWWLVDPEGHLFIHKGAVSYTHLTLPTIYSV